MIGRRTVLFVLAGRVDGLALDCEDPKDGFVNSAQRFSASKGFQRFHAEHEFAPCHGAFAAQIARPK